MDTLNGLMRQGLENQSFPGAVWQVSRIGEPELHSGAVGQAVVTPTAIPATLTTVYDLASVTKVVVSVALMRMLERGQLSLDDPVRRWFPAYQSGAKARVTLWHVLTHTGGIPGDTGPIMVEGGREAVIDLAAELPLEGQPGERVVYSSKGFVLLGAIMEAVAQRPLDQIVDQEINQQIGSRFVFNPGESLRPRIAATEWHPRRGRLTWGEVHDETCFRMGGTAGHAGLFGTVDDVHRFGQAMMDDSSPLMARSTKKMMIQNQTPTLNLARGLGWQGRDRHGSPAGDLMSLATFGHTGFTGTSLFCDPCSGVVAVLLTNRIHPSRDNVALLRFRRLFHNVASRLLGA